MRHRAALWLREFLIDRGIYVSKRAGFFSYFPTKLREVKARGLELRSAVDGGAAEGAWAREFKSVYPDAQILCVEPRQNAQANLRATAAELSGIQIAQNLLGPSAGEVAFNEHFDRSSVLPNSEGASFGNTSSASMVTLDSLVESMKFPYPDLIKLDLQGFELDAMRGAEQCLKNASALFLELSFFRFQKGAALAHEVIGFVAERGFRVYDITLLGARDLDGAMAQGDFLFLKESHPLLADNRWFADSPLP